MVFSGSLIVGGSAIAEVTATGLASEIGKIGASLAKLEIETPHLQRQMRKLVFVFAAVGASVSVAVVVLYGLLRGGWLEGVLAGIAVGMSMLPEEFPMVLAVFMAMGAWRISQGQGADAAGLGNRNAGGGIGPVHRQDRHIDRKPHDDRRIAPAGRDDGEDQRHGPARGISRACGGGGDGLGPRTVRPDGEGVSCAGDGGPARR